MKKLLLGLALATSLSAVAQNEAILTQYTVQPFLLNPAMAGFDKLHQVRLNYRSSWTGFPDAPNTYAVNYNGPIGKTFGIGGQILAENVASTFRYNVKATYAFNTVVDEFRIGGGFSTGFSNFRLRDRSIGGFDYDEGDQTVIDALDAKNTFDASLGFHGRYRDQTFAGLTFPSLISARLDELDSGEEPDDRGGADNFILRFGHEIRIKQRNFQVTPSVVLQRVFGAPFRVDFNAVASFLDEQFVAGLGYRAGVGNDVALMLGTKLDRLRLFYSYDINFGTFQTYNGGGHEITLGFDFDSRERSIDAARYE